MGRSPRRINRGAFCLIDLGSGYHIDEKVTQMAGGLFFWFPFSNPVRRAGQVMLAVGGHKTAERIFEPPMNLTTQPQRPAISQLAQRSSQAT